jgi:hypothetical protein
VALGLDPTTEIEYILRCFSDIGFIQICFLVIDEQGRTSKSSSMRSMIMRFLGLATEESLPLFSA